MKILIRETTIHDRNSQHHDKIRDVLIEEGIITSVRRTGRLNTPVDKEINGRDCLLTNGFFDLHVNFREPGYEYKEDIESGCKAAMAGGFTGVLQMPSTSPPIQSKSEIELIRTKTKDLPVDVYVAGALSVNLQGKDLAEMYDLFMNGAVCFTDDKHSVQDSGLLLRALLYTKNFHALVFSFCNEKYLSHNGQMNEGAVSTSLGLKGIPALAEEVMIARDLMLCEYAGTGIHFSTISTKNSVELIRKAKAKGMKVTCDVAAHHLLLSDTLLEEFDTLYKTEPPLRSFEDIAALRAGLKDGTIDAICSDHCPEDVENKKKEFEHAAFGAEGVETAFPAAFTALKDIMEPGEILEKFNSSPRKILSLVMPKIEEGEKANLTLINFGENRKVTEKHILSKSKNNPFIGMTLNGRVKATINKGQIHFSL